MKLIELQMKKQQYIKMLAKIEKEIEKLREVDSIDEVRRIPVTIS
jgi:hypothetical protein